MATVAVKGLIAIEALYTFIAINFDKQPSVVSYHSKCHSTLY